MDWQKLSSVADWWWLVGISLLFPQSSLVRSLLINVYCRLLFVAFTSKMLLFLQEASFHTVMSPEMIA